MSHSLLQQPLRGKVNLIGPKSHEWLYYLACKVSVHHNSWELSAILSLIYRLLQNVLTQAWDKHSDIIRWFVPTIPSSVGLAVLVCCLLLSTCHCDAWRIKILWNSSTTKYALCQVTCRLHMFWTMWCRGDHRRFSPVAGQSLQTD